MPAVEAQNREMGGPITGKEQHASVHGNRVLLADDNRAILNILKALLEPEFTVVGTVTQGGAVLEKAMTLKPDVVVLDISMGEPDGITVARQLQREYQHVRVVFLTVHEIAEFIRIALAAGASAYVFKSRLTTDLLPAMRAACSGRLFVSCQSGTGEAHVASGASGE